MHQLYQKVLVIFLFIFIGLIVKGQTISGVISDTTTKKNIANVVVAILNPKDSTLYKFVRTDKDGQFKLSNILKGKYIMLFTHPVFADLLDDINVPETGLQFNNISLIPKSKLLQELIIKSTAAMRIKGDTTIFTADSFKVSANANVEELLKKLPGIQVDKDGKIKAMGETVEKVLVDGEEFFGDDPGMAVKNLRADAVKEVQVYDKKSDQAVFTGIDDGKTKKTINLKLKDDRKHGFFGKADLSGGLKNNIDNRYNNNILFNAFKGKRKIAAYFLNGNTGQDGLGWQDNEKYGGGDDNFSLSADDDGNISGNWQGNSDDEPYVDTQNGLFKNNNIGLQYSNKWNDKQSLSFSPKYNFQDYNNNIKSFTQTQIADSFFNTNALEKVHVNKESFKINMVYDLKIDSANSIKFTAKLSDYKTESQSYRTSIVTGQTGNKNSTSERQLSTKSDKLTTDASLLFKHKFKKMRRSFSWNINWNVLTNDGKNFLLSDNEIYTNGIISSSQKFNQQKDYNKGTRRFVSSMVYTEPISKNYSLLFEYQLSTDNGNNDQTTYSYSPISDKYDNMVDSLTNLFDQRIMVNKGGFKINYSNKKLKYNFGSAIGFTEFNLADRTINKDYQRNYTNIFPNATLSYAYKSGHNLRFNYNGYTTQPRVDQLQLLRNNDDFFNQFLGNPLLRPSFTNNFQVNHQSFNFINEFSIWQSLSFSNTANAITNSRTINATTGKTTSQPVNTDGNYNFSFYTSVNFKIKKINLSVDIGPNANYGHRTEIINGQNNTSKDLNAGVNLYLYKSKDKRYDVSIYDRFNFNSNITQQYNTVLKYNTNELGADATFYIKKVWSIKTDITNYLRQKTPQFQDNLSNTLWNARVQRTFKSNEFTAYFSIKDILNQNNNVQRNFYSNTLTSVTNDRLRQYWLLGFTWNFKNKTTAAPAN